MQTKTKTKIMWGNKSVNDFIYPQFNLFFQLFSSDGWILFL